MSRNDGNGPHNGQLFPNNQVRSDLDFIFGLGLVVAAVLWIASFIVSEAIIWAIILAILGLCYFGVIRPLISTVENCWSPYYSVGLIFLLCGVVAVDRDFTHFGVFLAVTGVSLIIARRFARVWPPDLSQITLWTIGTLCLNIGVWFLLSLGWSGIGVMGVIVGLIGLSASLFPPKR